MFKPEQFSKILRTIFIISIIICLIDFISSLSYPILMVSDNLGIASHIWNYLDLKCHQLPERSLFYMGYQLPVCNRCFFILIGKISFCLLFLNKKLENNFNLIIPALLPPLIIEAILKIIFNYPSGFFIRSVNGFIQGFIIYLILYKAINYLSNVPEWKNIFYKSSFLKSYNYLKK